MWRRPPIPSTDTDTQGNVCFKGKKIFPLFLLQSMNCVDKCILLEKDAWFTYEESVRSLTGRDQVKSV